MVLCANPVKADVVLFNSSEPVNNVTTRDNWLAAVGITMPQYLVDFETGFTNGENVSGVTGLFPAGLVITDTSSSGIAEIISGAGSIKGSNPVGVYSLRQNEKPYLEFDFSSSPIDYFAFQDIDHTGTAVIVTFVGGATANYELESAPGTGDTAEFWGIYLNDMPPIIKLQFDSSGDGWWAVDTIEYGNNPIAGDLNADGFVGLDDLDIILNNWNATVVPGDLLAGDPSGDGYVGLDDLDIVLNNWNAGIPPSTGINVPEPATIVVCGLMCFWVFRGRGVRTGGM